jgi:hypothetical protein
MFMKKCAAAALALVALSVPGLRAEVPPETRDRALKVIAALEKLEADAARPKPRAPQSYTVTESDLNAWIAYRITTEMGEFVRSVELRLLDDNRAEGKIAIDLSGSPASVLLPARADFFFSARGETKVGKIRITIDSLFLGTQSLSPAFIDTVISVVAGLEGQPATSLKDWYPLPYGIRRLQSRPGRLICYYQ